MLKEVIPSFRGYPYIDCFYVPALAEAFENDVQHGRLAMTHRLDEVGPCGID